MKDQDGPLRLVGAVLGAVILLCVTSVLVALTIWAIRALLG